MRALLLLGVVAGSAAAQGTVRPEVESPIVEFKAAPFRTVTPEQRELIAPVETVTQAGVRLLMLDKMTGATEKVSLQLGETVRVGRLRIELATCEAPETGAAEGTRAFLKIWDEKHAEPVPDFSGWMFADSPALSALDHPRFDVWVISCTTS
ncbi:MAG: DUF2155 domain-containing protein [Pikeienuella sp.]